MQDAELTGHAPDNRDVWTRFKDGAGNTVGAAWVVIRVSFDRFLYDNCLIRANAIAYSVIISVIPLLTVLVKYAEVDQDTIRSNLARFMSAYGVTDSTEVLRILDEILSRANAIAGVGTAFMIISAANVLRNMEDAFNHIYRAKEERPFVYRFSLYISSLVILPGVLLLFGGGLRYVMNSLRPPELRHAARYGEELWVTSGRGGLIHFDGEKREMINLAKKVDPDAPFREIYFDLKTGKSGRYYEISGEAMPKLKLERSHFMALKKVAVGKAGIFAITDNGVLFTSTDSGLTWSHNLFGYKIDTAIRAPSLEDMILMDDGRLIILATQGSSSSLIYRDSESAFHLRKLDGIYHHIFQLKAQPKMHELFPAGLYLTGIGRYLVSPDGETWTGPYEEKFGNRSVELRGVAMDKRGRVFFAGADGALWVHANHEPKYLDLAAGKDDRINGMHIFPDGSGFVYGDNGFFRYTENGIDWHPSSAGAIRQAALLGHVVEKDGSVVFVGRNETLIKAKFESLSEARDAFGRRLAVMKIESYERYPALLSTALRLMFFLIGFTLTFALFLAAYRYLPNAFVEWKSAITGAVITATALMAFLLGFQAWVTDFSSTAYIYGVWAAVPVGMLVILVSVQIILFGLEMAFVIQHPHVRPESKGISRRETGSLFWNTAALLTLIYRQWENKRQPLRKETALDYLVDMPLLEAALDVLVRMQLVNRNRLTDEYFPVHPAREVKLRDLQSLLLKNAANIPDVFPDRLRSRIAGLQKKLTAVTLDGVGNMSVADLVKLMDPEDSM
ncbi:MAG: YihY/virulence factor BrkB family protein [Spirochaetia bacterium]|nr:YihY/virulence factor BrkB family protein [Spirochaetia bacterium]